jgi:uncharacterized membrane protein HdeD (DUF308 family)
MDERHLWTARRIVTGVGIIAAIVGLLAIVDPFDHFTSAAPPIGVALIAIGAYVVLRSAWLARRRPDNSPWNPLLDGDLSGGL